MGTVLAMRLGVVCTVAVLAAGCTMSAPAGSDAHELANFNPAHLTPKSSPRQMVATFEQACLNDGFATEAALRRMNFVPLTRTGPVRSYVVDDRRPSVMMGADGRMCAVTAASRTGQTDALAAMVAKRFPDARPMDAAGQARLGLERAWIAGGNILFLRRQVDDYSRLIFGISRAA